MKILMTAFDPFGGSSINPAWEVVSRLRTDWNGAELKPLLVPTVFGEAETLANGEAARWGADVVICVGQAGGRFEISFERIAVNLDDASIPDNRGNQPQDMLITPGGQNAYFSNLPVKRMAEAVRQAGIPATVSDTAGTFVCNHLFYKVMEEIDRNYPSGWGDLSICRFYLPGGAAHTYALDGIGNSNCGNRSCTHGAIAAAGIILRRPEGVWAA